MTEAASTRTCEVEIAEILHTMQRSTPSPPPLKKRKLAPVITAQEANQALLQKALPCRPPLLTKSSLLGLTSSPPAETPDIIPIQESPRSTLDLVDASGRNVTQASTLLQMPALRKRPRGDVQSNVEASIKYLLSLHAAYGANTFNLDPVAQILMQSRLQNMASVFSQCQDKIEPSPITPTSLNVSALEKNIPLCKVVGSDSKPPILPKQSDGTTSKGIKRVSSKPIKICRMDSCSQPAARRTPYCSSHSGPRRCEKAGCNKCAQGRTRFCISHGGGRRCTVEGCNKGARDRNFCAAHGGGRRCTEKDCAKLAVDKSGKCTAHGGGRRCESPDCPRSAQSNTPFCVRHGGGRKCTIDGCSKVARGRSGCCMQHSRTIKSQF